MSTSKKITTMETDVEKGVNGSRNGVSGRGGEASSSSSSSSGNSVMTQAGVKKVEALVMVWTRKSLYFAYAGIFLMAFCTSLDVQVTTLLATYATSSFGTHSLLSAVSVVSGVLNAVIQPPMAKVADVFGRTEAFAVSMLLYTLGYIQMAASKNVQSYASAQIFYASGSTGLRILQQIFIADTSDLLNRALLSSLPDMPFLVTVWIGPEIAGRLGVGPWRWGYGMWAVITPVLSLPLFASLWINQRKASKSGLLPEAPWVSQGKKKFLKSLWTELDILGTMLLTAAFSLILLPLTLASNARHGWENGSMITMIVIGGICLLIFPFWEMSKKLAPTPLLTLRLFKNRTVMAGCALGFFYFMAYYLSLQPYFYSYLLVARNTGPVAAGHITQSFSFASTVTSIIISLLIKYTKHYKYYMILGICIYMTGIGLLIKYRTILASDFSIIFAQIIVGFGGGMLNVPAQLGVQASCSHQEVGAATALFLTIVSVGGAVGSAVSGAIWSHNIPAKLAKYLPEASKADAKKIYGSIVVAKGFALGTPERVAVNRAYDETMRILLIVAVCVCVPMLPLGLCMKNYKLDEVDQGVKGNVFGSGRAAGEGAREGEGEREGERESAGEVVAADGERRE